MLTPAGAAGVDEPVEEIPALRHAARRSERLGLSEHQVVPGGEMLGCVGKQGEDGRQPVRGAGRVGRADPLGGLDQFGGDGHVPGGGGPHEVRGTLGHRRPGLGEGSGRPPVQLTAPPRIERAPEEFRQRRVAQHQDAPVLRVPDEVTAGQFSQDFVHGHPVGRMRGAPRARDGGEQLGRRTPVEHGEGLDDRPLRRGEWGELVEDHRHRPRAGRLAPARTGVREGAVVERVAESDGVDVPREAGRQPGDEPHRAVVRRQRAEGEPGEVPRVGGTGEDRGEDGRGLTFTAGQDEQNGCAEGMPEKMVDERDRGGIGSVEVVENEHQPRRGNPAERRRDVPYTVGTAPHASARTVPRVPHGGHRPWRFDEFREYGEGREKGTVPVVQVGEGVDEGLDGRAGVRLGGSGPAAQDRHPVPPGPYRELGEEPGLADARLTRDLHGHRARSLDPVAQQAVEPIELLGAPYKGRAVDAPQVRVRESVHLQSPSCSHAVMLLYSACGRTVARWCHRAPPAAFPALSCTARHRHRSQTVARS